MKNFIVIFLISFSVAGQVHLINQQKRLKTNYSQTVTIPSTSNMSSEQGYFDAYYVPIAQKANLQALLDTHGSIRLGEGDYSGISLTVSSNQKVYGHPSLTQTGEINIAAGTSNAVVQNIDIINGDRMYFLAGAPITNNVFKNLKYFGIRTTGGQIEDNLFINLLCSTNFDCSSSGYFRNNTFIRQTMQGGNNQILMSGNTTTPSYGNVHIVTNHLTPDQHTTFYDTIESETFLGLDAEGWNQRGGVGDDKAMLDMANMGKVTITNFQGGNGYAFYPETILTPALDIDAEEDIIFIDKTIALDVETERPSEIKGNANLFSFKGLGKVNDPVNYTGTGYNFQSHQNFNDYQAILNEAVQTSLITGQVATDLTNTILDTQYTPYAKPTWETLPDPLGVNWETERIGKTDSTTYIQNLIDTNGIADLPEGIFYIGSTLNITRDQGIVGQGTGKTVIVGLTDDFPLVTPMVTQAEGSGRFIFSNITFQGGLSGVYFPTLVNLVTLAQFDHVVFRDMTYGIHLEEIFGFDNNSFDNVSFVNCDIGFYQDPLFPRPASDNFSGTAYVDKNLFYKTQAINCGIGFKLIADRANNINAWVDCLFDGNGVAVEMASCRSHMFINTTFRNTTGEYVIYSGNDISFYSCDFYDNDDVTFVFEASEVILEGCNLLDNKQFTTGRNFFQPSLFSLNSTITGDLGSIYTGTFINTNFISHPEYSKLLVNLTLTNTEVLLDATPNPYPQLLVKRTANPSNPSPDLTSPSVVSNVNSSNVTGISADLSWNAATDNVDVSSYQIFNNGSFLKNVYRNTNTTLENLASETQYNLTVRAFDSSGNFSTSALETFTTGAAPAQSFVLQHIDSTDDSVVNVITDNYSVAVENATDFNINAIPSLSVGSVRFVITGAITRTETETAAPYALFGDSSGDYNSGTDLPVGSYTMVVSAWTGASATGTETYSQTINFTVTGVAVPVGTSIVGDKQYQKVTITLDGLTRNEGAITSFDYRMNVTITAPSSATYIVPGYFATDGNAAETSATSGNKWRCHFTPEEIGTYTYDVSFRTGNDVAVDLSPTAGTPTSIDGESGSFSIGATDITSVTDFRSKGKLQYNGTDTAVFDNGDYYFEVGADSPETFLEYSDFDATNARHDFSEVAANYVSGDPTWQSGKGTEIIGAVNYLASQGMNVHYFLTMNITGDGNNAYPFPGTFSVNIYDVSKLDQWQIVFDHMYNKGIVQELVLLETENVNWFEDQEGINKSNFSNSRKLYYREMIARFGYLNVIYNIGEEANWNNGTDFYTAAQIEEAASYIQSLSPYNDLITVHNGPSTDFTLFPQLTAVSGSSNLTSISFQGNFQTFSHGHNEIKTVKDLATADGTEWVVRYSEPYANGSAPDVDSWTENSLWASITAGSTGIHYYAAGGDVTVDNYTLYSSYYQRMKYAKEFLEDNNIPFWNMYNDNSIVNMETCLTDGADNHIIFLPDGGQVSIDLPTGTYTVKWFDPRNGGALLDGSVTTLSGGQNIPIGSQLVNTYSSWVVYIYK